MWDTNIVGFYFPALLSVAAFLRLHLSKGTHHFHPYYGIAFLISLLFAVQLPVLGIGGWTFEHDGHNQVKFVSVFPLLIMLYLWRHYRQHQRLPTISVPWMCLGSFSSSLTADVIFSYSSIDYFSFTGIGGAGWRDGLVIITVFCTLSSILINRQAKKDQQSLMA